MTSQEELLEKTRGIALEWCDESDIRFYPKSGEYHIVAPKEHTVVLLESLTRLGWTTAWKRENIRVGWDRIALKNPNIQT